MKGSPVIAVVRRGVRTTMHHPVWSNGKIKEYFGGETKITR